MDQYKEIINRKCSDLSLAKKFISKILDRIKETTLEKEALIRTDFSEENIKFVTCFFRGEGSSNGLIIINCNILFL
jgi:hypothetical protein